MQWSMRTQSLENISLLWNYLGARTSGPIYTRSLDLYDDSGAISVQAGLIKTEILSKLCSCKTHVNCGVLHNIKDIK